VASLQEVIDAWGQSGPLSRSGPSTLLCRIGAGAVAVDVTSEGPDFARLSATWEAPAWLITRESSLLPSVADLASGLEFQGGALLTAASTERGVQVSAPLYLEGLSRQSFVTAVAEVARAVGSLTRVAADLDAQRPALAEAERSMAEAQKAMDEANAALREAEAEAQARAPAEAQAAVQAATQITGQGPSPAQATSAQGGGAICASCGTANAAGVRFCTRCGQPLAAPAPAAGNGTFTPPAGQPAAAAGMAAPAPPPPTATARCRTCGAELAAGVRFCVTCGTPVA
jgi:hypothetical protein